MVDESPGNSPLMSNISGSDAPMFHLVSCPSIVRMISVGTSRQIWNRDCVGVKRGVLGWVSSLCV